MTKLKWHLLLSLEVRIVTRNNSLWNLWHLASHYIDLSGSVFRVCVLDNIWSRTKMSSGFHWFLPICKHSSHSERIELAFDFLAVQRTSFRPCRCSEQSQWPWPQTAVSEGQGCALPLCRSNTAQQCIQRFYRQLPALIATRITGGRQESHWDSLVESSLGLLCAVLGLPRNGPVAVVLLFQHGITPGPQSFLLPSFLGENLSILWAFTHISVMACCWKTLAAVEVISPGM